MIDKLYNKMKDYVIDDLIQINLFQDGPDKQRERGITTTKFGLN